MSTGLLAPEADVYITIKEAADALGERAWAIVKLLGAGKPGNVRAVRFGALLLVSWYDVEQLGGEFE